MLEEIFVTTKVANTHHSKGKVRECLQASLTALGLPYLDLYLIHTPMAVKVSFELYMT
jgi:diketogulonate reductase-like aldo/keto reductase